MKLNLPRCVSNRLQTNWIKTVKLLRGLKISIWRNTWWFKFIFRNWPLRKKIISSFPGRNFVQWEKTDGTDSSSATSLCPHFARHSARNGSSKGRMGISSSPRRIIAIRWNWTRCASFLSCLRFVLLRTTITGKFTLLFVNMRRYKLTRISKRRMRYEWMKKCVRNQWLQCCH